MEFREETAIKALNLYDQQSSPVGPDPKLRLVGDMKFDHPVKIALHQHYCYEFIYLCSGEYEYQHNGLHNRIQPGTGILLRPGDWHRDYVALNTHYIAVNFTLRSSDDCLWQKEIDPRCLVIHDENNEISRIVHSLCDESNRMADAFAAHLSDAYLRELYWLVLRCLPDKVLKEMPMPNNNERFAHAFQRIVMQKLRHPLGLAELASLLHLTSRTLNNRCREVLGMSPLHALMRIRMNYAYELLNQTSMSVKEISDYLGFQNPYHFSKAFKRVFFVPPTAIKHRSER